MLLFCGKCAYAQDFAVAETKAEPKPTPPVSKKKKAENTTEKILHYVGYLNFTDRTVDRMRSGKDVYEKYKGKVIRRVQIKILKPFGTDLDEPEKLEPNKAQKFANKLQVTTREWVVGNELLFHDGDTLMPVLIAESERNLWNRDNFKDVRLEVRQSFADTSEVEVVVYVRDRFSWSPYFKAQMDQIKGGIEFKNLMGIPQSILVYGGPKFRADNPYTLYAGYKYNNIANTHIDIGISGRYERLEKGGSLKIAKPFFSPFNKWGWSVKGELYREGALVPNIFAESIPSNVKYFKQDGWIAHSSPFTRSNEKNDLRRVIVAWRFKNYQYLDRPFLHNADYSLHYNSSWYLLSAIGVANWDYYLDKNIYSLGEAEYFTKGWNSAIIYGLHHDEEIGLRFCTGLKVNHGMNINHFGYWFTQLSGTGFLHDMEPEQINVAFVNTFFSAPIMIKKYYIRHFFKAKIDLGFLQPDGHNLIVNNESGDLRGFYYNTLQGQRSYTMSYQMNVYPPFKVLGFTSCVFAFADLAWVGQQGAWNNNKFAQSVGFGLRVRHMGLGIDYFEISFAYMPTSLPNQKPYNVIPNMRQVRATDRADLFTSGIVAPDGFDH